MNAPTRHWHELSDARVQCDLCPRHCRLREGQRGFCFVRANVGGALVLTTWGRSSGFCVDPVEKKPLFHFLPGSAVLSFGTAGCNLACRFCQNWSLTRSRELDRLCDEARPEQVARAARALGCRGVAFTYNDPVIFHEYAVDVARACRAAGLRTVAVTAGYVCPRPRAEFYRHMDAANIDLKAFSEGFYRRVVGARLAPVLETLAHVARATDVWLELTTLLIPGLNDSDAELAAMTRWVATELGPDVPMHFTAFQPAWRMADRPPTPPATLARARRIALESGVRFAYSGNVHDPDGQSTRCPACGALLIGRDGYELGAWNLGADGACAACGARCPGVFRERPGTWGSRRRPVHLPGPRWGR